jgi:hypothetical protein
VSSADELLSPVCAVSLHFWFAGRRYNGKIRGKAIMAIILKPGTPSQKEAA